MVRVLAFVVVVFLLSAGLAWLADRPGSIVLNWQGYEIRTSLMLAAVAVAVIIAAILVLWALLRTIVRAPKTFESYLGRRRRDRGYKALSDGMIAVGAGDVKAAGKAAGESRTLLGDEPLPLLLSAQAAQLAGDGAAARGVFETLAEGKETKVLGLHGLFIEARRQNHHDAARHFAEQAVAAAPKIGWAGTALFEYQSRAGEWLAAMRVLEANVRAGIADKQEAKPQRAALLTARALELEAGDPQEARAAALEAHRLDPGLVPAAAVASRLLSRISDFRRAARVIETTWKLQPHPDLADAYAVLRPGDSVRDRLKRMRRLAELRANHPEGAKALARGAIDAHDWETARKALDGLAKSTPSETVCLLMAEIEGRQHGDEGKVRMWLARAINAPREAAWVADGQVHDQWAPITPVTGTVGGFVWEVPSEPPPSRVAIEIEASFAGDPSEVAEPEVVPRIEAKPAVAAMAPAVPETAVKPVTPEPASAVADAAETPTEPTSARAGSEPGAGGAVAAKADAATVDRPAEVTPDGDAGSSNEAGSKAATEPATDGEDADGDGSPSEDEADTPVPPSPDDPGPEAEDDETEAPRRKRFGMF